MIRLKMGMIAILTMMAVACGAVDDETRALARENALGSVVLQIDGIG